MTSPAICIPQKRGNHRNLHTLFDLIWSNITKQIQFLVLINYYFHALSDHGFNLYHFTDFLKKKTSSMKWFQ